MSVLPLRYYGDPILREVAQPVAPDAPGLGQFIADMTETMYASEGIGLAANQVGDLRRVLIYDVAQVAGPRVNGRRQKNASNRVPIAMLNAEVIESSDEDEAGNEGCLSIPTVEADVFRPRRVKVRYQTPNGELHETWFDGLTARVLQHEIDHLNGVLFTDRLTPEERAGFAGALRKIREKLVASKNP